MPILSGSVPSQSTATNILANSGFAARAHCVLENQGNARIYFSFNDDADVTVAGGAKPGISLGVNEKFSFTRNMASPNSNTGGIWLVQTSGSAQAWTLHYSQA